MSNIIVLIVLLVWVNFTVQRAKIGKNYDINIFYIKLFVTFLIFETIFFGAIHTMTHKVIDIV